MKIYNLKFCFVCAIEKLKSESTFFKAGLEWNGFSLVITLVEFVNSVRHLMNEWGPWDVVLSGKKRNWFHGNATALSWFPFSRDSKSYYQLKNQEKLLWVTKVWTLFTSSEEILQPPKRQKKLVTRRCYKRLVNWNQTMCDVFNICINEIWGLKMSAFHLFMTQVTSTSPCNKGIATVLIVNTWWIL